GSKLTGGFSLDGEVESRHYESRMPYEGESDAIPGTFSISLCEEFCNSNSRFVRITGIPFNARPGRYRFGENRLVGYFGHLGALFAYNQNPRGFLEIESFGETLTGHFDFTAENGDESASVKGRFEKIPVPRN
ncbi:MAG TPA: hypothetical protein VMN76_09140, partial [Acidobacteriota bacterium]|nr:hypothetical protein [Acidobacteriota bacterium]